MMLSMESSSIWELSAKGLHRFSEAFNGRGLTFTVGEQLSVRVGNQEIYAVRETKPKVQLQAGVCIIPVSGVLMRRPNFLERFAGATDANELTQAFQKAVADPEVKSILLDVDSDGGDAGGPMTLCDAIFKARGVKPIWSHVNEVASSAAYKVASAADRVIVSPTSLTGGIGVLGVILKQHARNARQGRKIHVIKAGEYKDATHPDTPLSDGGRQVLQEMVDSYYILFVETIARNRGMDVGDALDLATGREWVGRQAVELGLADDVMSFDEAFKALRGPRMVQVLDDGRQVDVTGLSPSAVEELVRSMAQPEESEAAKPAVKTKPAKTPTPRSAPTNAVSIKNNPAFDFTRYLPESSREVLGRSLGVDLEK